MNSLNEDKDENIDEDIPDVVEFEFIQWHIKVRDAKKFENADAKDKHIFYLESVVEQMEKQIFQMQIQHEITKQEIDLILTKDYIFSRYKFFKQDFVNVDQITELIETSMDDVQKAIMPPPVDCLENLLSHDDENELLQDNDNE